VFSFCLSTFDFPLTLSHSFYRELLKRAQKVQEVKPHDALQIRLSAKINQEAKAEQSFSHPPRGSQDGTTNAGRSPSQFCVEQEWNQADAVKTTSRIERAADFAAPEQVSFSNTDDVPTNIVSKIQSISDANGWAFLHPDLKEAVEKVYPKSFRAQRKAVAYATNHVNLTMSGATGECSHRDLLFMANGS